MLLGRAVPSLCSRLSKAGLARFDFGALPGVWVQGPSLLAPGALAIAGGQGDIMWVLGGELHVGV